MIPTSDRRGGRFSHKNLTTGVLLFLFTSIGFIARIWNANSMSLWVDEAISARAAQGILLRGVPTVSRFGEGLYFYDRGLLHSYLVAASFKLFGESTLSARIPGIIFGVMLIPLVYFLGKYTVNTRVGIYAASLASLHPWLIATSRYTRFYAEFQTLFILALVMYLLWLRSVNSTQLSHSTPISISQEERQTYASPYPYLILLGVTLVAAYLTHRFYVLIIAILISFTVFHIISTRTIRSLLTPKPLFVIIVLPSALIFGLAVGILPTELLKLISLANYSDVEAMWIIDYFLANQPLLFYLSALGTVILAGRIIFSNSQKYGDFLIFCFAITIVSLSYGVPVLVGSTSPRYFSPVIPLVILTAAYTIDEAVRFTFKHPDVRSITAFFSNYITEGKWTVTTVVAFLILIGTLPTATPHFESNGYHAEFSYGSRVQQHDLEGPAGYILNQSSEDVTVYVRPLNTPTFYLNWEHGRVRTIRFLKTVNDGLLTRWADDEYIIETNDELKQQVREDANRGEVWFLVKNWWKQPDRANWVRKYSTRVNGSWKSAELYKYRGDEIVILDPKNTRWEENIVSVDQNVFGTPKFLALGRQVDKNVTWGATTGENRGELILRIENRWDTVVLSTRVYGADQDRHVSIYYSSDSETWTKAIDHDAGGWKTYNIRLDGIHKDDETIYLRLEGGSSKSKLGGLVDYLRLEPHDFNDQGV